MENTLKRLLAVETEAEQLVTNANAEREQILQQTLQEIHQAEHQFQTNLPQIQARWLAKAEERAHHTIAELTKRYEERKSRLRTLAEENQPKALQAAVHLLIQLGQEP